MTCYRKICIDSSIVSIFLSSFFVLKKFPMKILTWENLKHCSPPSCADIVVTSLYSIRIRRQFFCGVELERFEWALIGHFFWSGDFNLEENKKIELHIKSQLAVGRTRPEKPARVDSYPTRHFPKSQINLTWPNLIQNWPNPRSNSIQSNSNQHTIKKMILKLARPKPSITQPNPITRPEPRYSRSSN